MRKQTTCLFPLIFTYQNPPIPHIPTPSLPKVPSNLPFYANFVILWISCPKQTEPPLEQ